MTEKLIGYSAFWHSDKPWGFGASLIRHNMPDDLFDTFYEQAEQLGENLHLHTDMTVGEAKRQLRQFIAQYNQLRTKDITEQKISLLILMFGNVKFLTLKGAILDNEWNGLQYAYAM